MKAAASKTSLQHWTLAQVKCNHSMLGRLHEMNKKAFHLIGTNGFHVKARMNDLLLRTRVVEPQIIWRSTSSFDGLHLRNAPNTAACAAQLLFLIQPIIRSLRSYVCSSRLSIVNSFIDFQDVSATLPEALTRPQCLTSSLQSIKGITDFPLHVPKRIRKKVLHLMIQ